MPSPEQGPKAFHIVTAKSDPKEESNAPLLAMQDKMGNIN
jgi:hypothetical protein